VVGRRYAGQEPALAKAGVAELVLPVIERSGPIEAWIIDDTGFPKRGGIRLE
jgi:SRSO17 transposase